MSTKENMSILFDKFESFIKSQTIVGKEIKIGEVSILPLSDVSFIIGGGGGEDNDEGIGIAAKATPTSLLIVNSCEVKLLPIRKGSSFDAIIESVPNLIDKLSALDIDKDKIPVNLKK